MQHPYLCAMLLALPYVLSLWLGRPLNLLDGAEAVVNALGGKESSGSALLLAASVPLGAFIASVPGRLKRRRREKRPPATMAQCVGSYLGGMLSALGCLTAGGGFSLLLISGGMVGTLSALAFAGTVGFSAWFCAILRERRRAA